jgi:hypothetical protein
MQVVVVVVVVWVSVVGSPCWCVPRKTVVVVVMLNVSVRRSAWPDGQLGSSIISTATLPIPIPWTQVVIPESNVQVVPSGGVIGGSADADAGRAAAATVAAMVAANGIFMASPSDRLR